MKQVFICAMWRSGAACLLAAFLYACGGGDDTAALESLRHAQAAARPVALQDLPDLHTCLDGLSQRLRQPSAMQDLSLNCLAGTYRGVTPSGDDCYLQINAGEGRFTFGVGRRRTSILWGLVALDAAGRPLHNLETADLDSGRPGVQLTRFTALPVALTETLALRAGLARPGPQGLPHIHYLRATADKVEDVQCRFGAK